MFNEVEVDTSWYLILFDGCGFWIGSVWVVRPFGCQQDLPPCTAAPCGQQMFPQEASRGFAQNQQVPMAPSMRGSSGTAGTARMAAGLSTPRSQYTFAASEPRSFFPGHSYATSGQSTAASHVDFAAASGPPSEAASESEDIQPESLSARASEEAQSAQSAQSVESAQSAQSGQSPEAAQPKPLEVEGTSRLTEIMSRFQAMQPGSLYELYRNPENGQDWWYDLVTGQAVRERPIGLILCDLRD